MATHYKFKPGDICRVRGEHSFGYIIEYNKSMYGLSGYYILEFRNVYTAGRFGLHYRRQWYPTPYLKKLDYDNLQECPDAVILLLHKYNRSALLVHLSTYSGTERDKFVALRAIRKELKRPNSAKQAVAIVLGKSKIRFPTYEEALKYETGLSFRPVPLLGT